MKKVFEIIIQDIKNIYRVPSVIILMVGLAILPSFYAWFNISSMWDPYSNTSDIKIAIVNVDQGATVRHKDVNIGNNLTRQLKDNNKLGWVIEEDIDEANEKVYTGEYFASIYIPKDFSKNVTSILTGEPKRAVVHYKVNEKINAVAPKMTNAGATEITETINDEFVQTTSSALLDEFNQAGLKLEKELPTLNQIKDAVYSTYNHLDELDDAAQLILEMDQKQEDIEHYADEFHKLNRYEDDIRQAGQHINTAYNNMDKINRASQLVIQLDKNMPQIEQSVQKMNEIPQYFEPLNRGVDEALQKTHDTEEKIKKIQTKIPSIQQDIEKYTEQVNEYQNKSHTAQQTIDSVYTDVNNTLNQAVEKIDALDSIDDVQSIIDDMTSVQSNLTKMDAKNEEKKQLNESTEDIIQKLNSIKTTSTNIEPSTESPSVETATSEPSSESPSVETATSEPSSESTSVETATSEPSSTTLKETTDTPVITTEDKEILMTLATSIKSQVNDLNTNDNSSSNKTSSSTHNIDDQKIQSQLSSIQDDTTRLLNQISNNLSDNINITQHNIETLPTIATQLEQSSTHDQANKQLDQLEHNVSGLIDTVSGIKETTTTLKDYIPEGQYSSIQQTLDQHSTSLSETDKALSSNDLTVEDAKTIKEKTVTTLKSMQSYNTNTLKPTIDETLNSINDSLNEADDKLAQAMHYTNVVDNYLSKSNQTLNTMQDYLSTLNQKLPQYEDKFLNVSSKMNQYFPQFKDSIHTASTFAQNDLPKIQSELTSLNDFVNNDMDQVLNTYHDADDSIQNNLPTAMNHLDEMAEFVRNDWPEYREGLIKAYKKIKEIDDDNVIEELIQALENNLSDQTEYFSRPVQLEEEKLFPIPNYGSANAPFYTTLAIWVGALLLCNLISTDLKNEDAEKDYSLRHIYFGRMFLFLVMGINQTLIATIGNFTLLNVYAKHPIKFIIFALFISIAFNMIVYTLVSIFGNIGKALGMILMIIQLSGGGGTFPIEVAPDFFQMIHPFLPFTYAIDLLREASGGIIWSVVIENMVKLALFPILFILLGYTFRPFITPIAKKMYQRSYDSNLID